MFANFFPVKTGHCHHHRQPKTLSTCSNYLLIAVAPDMQRILLLLILGNAICSAFLTIKPALKLQAKRVHIEPPKHVIKFKAMSSLRSTFISIDHTVLPPLVGHHVNSYGASLAFAAVMLYTVFNSLKYSLSSRHFNASDLFMGNIFNTFGQMDIPLKSWCKQKWFHPYKRKEQLNLTQWNMCKLAHVEHVSAEYNLYSFNVPSGLSSRLNLDIAQEVSKNWIEKSPLLPR